MCVTSSKNWGKKNLWHGIQIRRDDQVQLQKKLQYIFTTHSSYISRQYKYNDESKMFPWLNNVILSNQTTFCLIIGTNLSESPMKQQNLSSRFEELLRDFVQVHGACGHLWMSASTCTEHIQWTDWWPPIIYFEWLKFQRSWCCTDKKRQNVQRTSYFEFSSRFHSQDRVRAYK